MDPVKPVTITLPDGTERQLRDAFGARKLIHEKYGCGILEAIQKYDSGALPGILHAMMHDADGNPPNVTEQWLAWNLPASAALEMMAAIGSACSQGQTSKNEIEGLMIQGNQNGSVSGHSVLSSSESQTLNSGGDTSHVKSTPESIGTTAASSSSDS